MPTSLSLSTQSRLTELGKILTDARLPKNVSSEFFSELAQKDECICARPIGVEEQHAIYQRKRKLSSSGSDCRNLSNEREAK